ncbi:hypothetical protein [Hyphomonas pacifica]|nr:hypothetical protein [Hyphomonas pacifica]
MQCSKSTDAWLFPDWNDPERGELLKQLYPPERWEGRIDLDIRPPISSAEALLAALIATLATIRQDAEEAAGS